MNLRAPTSEVLNGLLSQAPGEWVTLEWLMRSLGERSFGIILLLLALLGLLPGVSAVAGILTLLLGLQMILAHHNPVIPRRVARRAIEVQRLAELVRRILPVLRWMERFVRPRFPTPFEATKRVVGAAVLLLGLSLLAPLPLSNVLPALVLALVAFAYLEEDGLLLCVALGAALVILVIGAMIAWETISAIGLVSSVF